MSVGCARVSLTAWPLEPNHLFQLKQTVEEVAASSSKPSHPEARSRSSDSYNCTTATVAAMANLPVTVTMTEPQLGEFWEKLQRGCLSNCSSIVFNPEDTQLYPRICKTHLWQVILREAIVQYELQPNTTCTLTLYQGQVSYTPMEPFIFTIDAVFRSCQTTKEEITFLRNVGLERFITQVPWGVLHPNHGSRSNQSTQGGGHYHFSQGKRHSPVSGRSLAYATCPSFSAYGQVARRTSSERSEGHISHAVYLTKEPEHNQSTRLCSTRFKTIHQIVECIILFEPNQ